jgi:uncharacterized protein YbjT (DUF2867 family)
MKVLVVGGTGTVGSAVARALAARGHQPRVMTRSGAAAARVPSGLPAVSGDLAQPSTLPAAFEGADACFLAVPVAPNETALALAGVEAARAAGVGRLVYLSARMAPGCEAVPHVAAKIPAEQAVRDSGLAWTILRPNNFFQNDAWFRDAITRFGVYPQPIGSRGVNRVDVRDIAEAAVNAFTRDGGAGTVPLNGPRGMTGEDTARIYGEILGKTVRYGGDDLDVWAHQAAAVYPARMVDELRVMYDYFIRCGAHGSGRDFAAQEALLGHAPRPFEAFAAELVREWRMEAGPYPLPSSLSSPSDIAST